MSFRPEVAEQILEIAGIDTPGARLRRLNNVWICICFIGMGLAIRRRYEPDYAR